MVQLEKLPSVRLAGGAAEQKQEKGSEVSAAFVRVDEHGREQDGGNHLKDI